MDKRENPNEILSVKGRYSVYILSVLSSIMDGSQQQTINTDLKTS